MFKEIMMEFAELTGLSSDRGAPRRYLWTDAFAVCNFLGLYRQTGDQLYMELALHLIDQVHTILGRHRSDDPRTGWISGLDEEEGKRHPTRGGLRIGKTLNERKPDEPYDERREWDRDGQYYHYLTKWMHALNLVSKVCGDTKYNVWAIELAKTAHAAFTYALPFGGRKSMYWKMSIDLTYPLVSSMGHLDPLDGFITYLQLQAAAAIDSRRSKEVDLSKEIIEMARMCEGQRWVTDDPLGLGELLSSAYKLAQLILREGFKKSDLLCDLLDDAWGGLQSFEQRNILTLPAEYRLAFRELGLSIGLHAVEKLLELIKRASRTVTHGRRLQSQAESLARYVPLSQSIEQFWLEPENRRAESWTAHMDINMVMLATSLAPDGYL